jgi:hypothetical protein
MDQISSNSEVDAFCLGIVWNLCGYELSVGGFATLGECMMRDVAHGF